MPVWMVTGAKLKTSYSLDHIWKPAVKYGLMCIINPRRACARVTVVNPRRACARGLR